MIIGDGLKGTDDIEVPVQGGEYIEKAKIGRAVMDADVFISLTHFKGHETTGFGGTIRISEWDVVPEPVRRISILLVSRRSIRKPAEDVRAV